jgi:uncharacterized protein
MPERLVIDALDLARTAASHHGKIALSELKRLQGYLVGNCGELNYIIRGALARDGKPLLRIIIQGFINLRCQRCLGELRHVLNVQRDLSLARDERELSRLDEDESADGVLATPDMDVMALIEDEIILSLPISPRHGESECSIGPMDWNDASEKPLFAGLAQLKLH